MGRLPDLSREGLGGKKNSKLGYSLSQQREKGQGLDFLPDVYSAPFNDDSGSPFRWNDSSPTIKISSVAVVEFVSCASSLHTGATVSKVGCSSNRMTSTL